MADYESLCDLTKPWDSDDTFIGPRWQPLRFQRSRDLSFYAPGDGRLIRQQRMADGSIEKTVEKAPDGWFGGGPIPWAKDLIGKDK